MKINLTKKQYESLAKIVFLGNWVANANRTGQPNDPHLKEYEEIADYIYSLSTQFGLPDSYESEVEFSDEPHGTSEVERLYQEYDEASFWGDLPDKLGTRDFVIKYSKKEREEMTEEDYFIKTQECIIEWENEMEEYGIVRLEIKENGIKVEGELLDLLKK